MPAGPNRCLCNRAADPGSPPPVQQEAICTSSSSGYTVSYSNIRSIRNLAEAHIVKKNHPSQVVDRNEGELSGPAGSGCQAHQAV